MIKVTMTTPLPWAGPSVAIPYGQCKSRDERSKSERRKSKRLPLLVKKRGKRIRRKERKPRQLGREVSRYTYMNHS